MPSVSRPLWPPCWASNRCQVLADDALLRQLDDWVDRDIAEPSFAQAVGAVVRNPDWLDLSDQTFALLGPSSSIGPYPMLMRWSARVAAVARPSAATWDRPTAAARRGPGTLLVPVRQPAADLNESAGADLMTKFGAVATRLRGIDEPLTIGNCGYALGAGFVRLTMAVDELLDRLTWVRSIRLAVRHHRLVCRPGARDVRIDQAGGTQRRLSLRRIPPRRRINVPDGSTCCWSPSTSAVASMCRMRPGLGR